MLNTDELTATAVKIAAHVGLSWEIINDFTAFHDYAGTEIYKQIIDLENALLLQGGAGEEFDGTGSVPFGPAGFSGFQTTAGILTHNAAGDTGSNVTALDSVEIAIAALRSGPALAVPDLFVLHPNTFSALRRIKDAYGRFILEADPTQEQASSIWAFQLFKPFSNRLDMVCWWTPKRPVMSLSANHYLCGLVTRMTISPATFCGQSRKPV